MGQRQRESGRDLLLPGKAIQQNRLARGLETAAGETLHYPKENQLGRLKSIPNRAKVCAKIRKVTPENKFSLA
jgi:hypothetical protein